MRTTVDKTGVRRNRQEDGRFSFETACDACGRTIPTKAGDLQHYTDADVCGNGDGPGFYLCGRKNCLDTSQMGVESRRRVYEVQRQENRLAAGEHRRPRRMQGLPPSCCTDTGKPLSSSTDERSSPANQS